MKVIFAVLAVALVLPAGAFAMPTSGLTQDQRAPDQQDPMSAGPRVQAIGTDVAAPDQQSPVTRASRLPAVGTDVAASDQQAPRFAPHVTVAAVQAPDAGFDAADAAMGAAGAALVMCIALGGAVMVRRRREPSAAVS
jgi:hypothetical protein